MSTLLTKILMSMDFDIIQISNYNIIITLDASGFVSSSRVNCQRVFHGEECIYNAASGG